MSIAVRSVLVLVIAFVLFSLYTLVRFYQKVHVSEGIISRTTSYQKDSGLKGPSVLVIGDSTGVGVGASLSEQSLAGRISDYIAATYVENNAVSGVVVHDLPGQIAKSKREHYSLILVQIGGNDIVRFHNASSTAALLASELKKLPRADKVIVISAGDVGSATIFPWPLNYFYTRLNLAYHKNFAEVCTSLGFTYVNLYTAAGSDLFNSRPDIYLAADGFHPSGEGYGLWFNAIESALK